MLTTGELNTYFFIVSDHTADQLIIITHTPSELSVLLYNSIYKTLIVRENRYLHIIERHWDIIHHNHSSKTPSCFIYKPSRVLITNLAVFLASSVSHTVGRNHYSRHSQYIPEKILGYKDGRLFTLVCNRHGEVITLYPRHF